ncbi:UNC-like C-terminal-domain-containing protein [Lipomyces japonicus]|uniref:UNC-like C-terminal-domain-containing protein n=1 Tax=Lipomyces japonicus TaxID=56871 RepID=UPI0034CE45D6
MSNCNEIKSIRRPATWTTFLLAFLFVIQLATGTLVSASIVASSTCNYRTVNYITHSLPQQCLRSSRSTARSYLTEKNMSNSNQKLATSTSTISAAATTARKTTTIRIAHELHPSSIPTATQSSTDEFEIDYLANSGFLSFEEWKNQNLAHAGNAADEAVNRASGQSSSSSSSSSSSPPRRRPITDQALDAIGDDLEIELSFFGDGSLPDDKEETKADVTDQKIDAIIPEGGSRMKHAGKTSKERSNYASLDCAATILKTNPELRGANSILVENKDTYMRNPCGVHNKFIIVELCEYILVDTVVLANYEFFSSMARTFRVSVSERYPIKEAGWNILGEFEARNSRDIQAFPVRNPLVWAKYLRIEFVSHWGDEFYCPLSLLRVHGTTMIEEYRYQEELNREEEDEEEDQDPVQVTKEVELEQVATQVRVEEPVVVEPPPPIGEEVISPAFASFNHNIIAASLSTNSIEDVANCDFPTRKFVRDKLSELCDPIFDYPGTDLKFSGSSNHDDTLERENFSNTATSVKSELINVSGHRKASTVEQSTLQATAYSATVDHSSEAIKGLSPVEDHYSSIPQNVSQASTSSAYQASPTTQESVYKTIIKRLSLLEANATLSLQYIEEQSRMLRDAFTKVERRQQVKVSDFLDALNTTVLSQLHEFKQQYEQLWQSTVIELESQKEQVEKDISEVSSRLTVVVDELVYQKRISVVQSIILLVLLLIALMQGSVRGRQMLEYREIGKLLGIDVKERTK